MKKMDNPLNIRNAEKHRKENCIHYASCLEEASAMLWPSFSCVECKHFTKSEKRMPDYNRSASPLGWEI